jgi:hypothetical protein
MVDSSEPGQRAPRERWRAGLGGGQRPIRGRSYPWLALPRAAAAAGAVRFCSSCWVLGLAGGGGEQLVLEQRDAAQHLVEAPAVVPADPAERVVLRMLVGGEAAPLDELAVKAGPERLSDRVVVGVARAADRGSAELIQPVGVGE